MKECEEKKKTSLLRVEKQQILFKIRELNILHKNTVIKAAIRIKKIKLPIRAEELYKKRKSFDW